MQHQPMLQAEQIYLREVSAIDVNQEYYGWLNDPEVNQYLETRFVPQSLGSIAEFVASKQGNGNEPLLAICTRDGDKHIGNIKLGPINWYHRRADISLLIGNKDYWGRGIASEAIQLICQFAFTTLNLNKLCAGAYAPNLGSIGAFKRCGFDQEGYIRDYALVAGEGVDVILLGLTAKQYFSQS